MKKLTALFMSIMLVLGLSACGNSNASGNTSASASTNTAEESSAAANTENPEEQSASGRTETPENQTATDTESESGKTLVAYYSASGHTQRVAQDIADAAGADLFEIVPEEVYTDADLDWTNEDSRVSREHEDESLRDVPLTATEVPDWEEYDTVFIGYPIWWAIAAWPVDGFVTANDFTGKTVIPFATSASSGMGQSGELLADMAGTGDWQEGQRFSSGASTEEVQEWVGGLGL